MLSNAATRSPPAEDSGPKEPRRACNGSEASLSSAGRALQYDKYGCIKLFGTGERRCIERVLSKAAIRPPPADDVAASLSHAGYTLAPRRRSHRQKGYFELVNMIVLRLPGTGELKCIGTGFPHSNHIMDWNCLLPKEAHTWEPGRVCAGSRPQLPLGRKQKGLRILYEHIISVERLNRAAQISHRNEHELVLLSAEEIINF